MALAELYLKGNRHERSIRAFRIGQGYDCHALVPGRKLIIGGVDIPHATGLLGHSDADVLLHAITDALIGAAGLGDIGRHFPDTDPRFAGADSRALLREIVRASGRGRLCDRQRRCHHHRAGAEDGAAYSADDREHRRRPRDCRRQVNVKAKTNEKLGYLGREEGIAAEAVALVYR